LNPKDDFLYRLAVSVEDAERKSGNRPDDKHAAADAAALRELYGRLAGFPADHVFFRAMRLVPPQLTTRSW
jgi:hypothetical protein